MAARAIGLDCGPMSGFDNEAIDREFFPGGQVKSNFICAIGYGDPAGLFERLPRPDVNEVCSFVYAILKGGIGLGNSAGNPSVIVVRPLLLMELFTVWRLLASRAQLVA